MTHRKLIDEWPTVALFALSFYVITLTAFVSSTVANTLFRTLAQAIVITGLIGIALAHHYRSEQAKADEIKRLQDEITVLRAQVKGMDGGEQ